MPGNGQIEEILKAFLSAMKDLFLKVFHVSFMAIRTTNRLFPAWYLPADSGWDGDNPNYPTEILNAQRVADSCTMRVLRLAEGLVQPVTKRRPLVA